MVLATCLKGLLGEIVFDAQNAFIKGRQSGFSIDRIANECLDSHMKSVTPRVLCKLDVEKLTITQMGIFQVPIEKMWVRGEMEKIGRILCLYS